MSVTHMLKDMAVAKVRGVRPEDSVSMAHALMETFNVDQVPILDDEESLVGVVTRRQLFLIPGRGDKKWAATRVGDVKVGHPYDRNQLLRCASTPLDEVFEYLFAHDFVLITEDGKKITGIVTINDVARFLYGQLNPDSP